MAEDFADKMRLEAERRAELMKALEAEEAEKRRRLAEIRDIAMRLASIAKQEPGVPSLRYVRIEKTVQDVGRFSQKKVPRVTTVVVAQGWPLTRQAGRNISESGSSANLQGLALLTDGRIATYWHVTYVDRWPDGGIDVQVSDLTEMVAAVRTRDIRLVPESELASRYEEVMNAMAGFAVTNSIDPALLK